MTLLQAVPNINLVERSYYYHIDKEGHIWHDGTEIADPRFLHLLHRDMKRTSEGKFLVLGQRDPASCVSRFLRNYGLIYNLASPMEFKVPAKEVFKIGEVCEMLQVEPYVLRYWETEFDDLRPEKNAMGQRVYRAKDIEIVYLIKKLLYEEGYTILGARKQLKREIAKLASSGALTQEEIVDRLRKLRWELQEILTLLNRNDK